MTSVTFRTITRCDRCEHGNDHGCALIQNEVRMAVAEANGRAARHGIVLPPATVVLDCQGFWRRGRSHGSEQGGSACS